MYYDDVLLKNTIFEYYFELHSHHDCAESCKLFHNTWQNKSFAVHYCNLGGTPYDGLYGEAPPESGFSYMKSKGFHYLFI